MPSCLIVASNFPPIQSAGVYRTLRIVKYLPALGWNLNVLTLSTDTLLPSMMTDDNLLQQVGDEIQVYRSPARFPIEAFNRITGRGKAKQIKTASRKMPGAGRADKHQNSKGGSRISWTQWLKDRLTLPWMTPDRMVGWVSGAAKLGTKVARRSQPDLIYSSGPPWSNHLVAGRIVDSTGIPWVADFRDPWVGNAFRPNRSGDSWAGRKHRMLEAEVYRLASVVIFNTARARQDAVERIGGGLAAKSVVIPNGFDPEHFQTKNVADSVKDNFVHGKPRKMVHAGAFYGARNIDSLLSVIGEMKRAGQLTSDNFQLELIGRIRDHEKSLIHHHSIDDLVSLKPPIPHQECLQQLRRADVLLLVQTEAPLCVPGKMYEYIAIGKPILTLAGEGSTADLVAMEHLGICIDPADRERLKSGLLQLIQAPDACELRQQDASVRDRYDGRQQMALFDEVFRRAISKKKPARQETA